MTTENQVAVAQPGRSFALTPRSLDEAMQFAGMLAKSSIVPKDFIGNPGNILVAVQWGAEIGLAPLQAMQSIAIINGRPAIWGDAALALVRGSGLLEYISETHEGDVAVCTLKRKGEPEAVRTFSMEEAKRAGLTGKSGPWTQYPKRMLQLRARAFALRDVFPDVLRGVHVAEEAQDIPIEKHMGPAEEVAKQVEPQSRAERARAAVAKKKAAPPAIENEPSPALEAALGAIHAAQSMDELAATGATAGALTEAELEIAKGAYKARKAEIAAAAAVAVDAATGEILPAGEEPAE